MLIVLLFSLFSRLVTEAVEEGIKALHDATVFGGQAIDFLLYAHYALPGARFGSVLLNWVNFWVDFDSQHVLVSFQLLFYRVPQPVLVVDNEAEFGAVDVSLFVAIHSLKGSSHDGNDHVENDEKRDECTYEENQPEHNFMIHVSIKAPSHLKIAQCQSVGINEAISKASQTCIRWLKSVLIEDPEE